jgi:RecB family exonuclease
VQGRIDRIDRADDGLGIRVLDYKTGKSMLRQDAMADDLQLATYHLAATRDTELATWGPPTQLRLLYLRRMETREQEVRPDHAELTEGRILTAAGDILAEAFEPSAHADCDHCDFHRLCPLWDEGREVGEK